MNSIRRRRTVLAVMVLLVTVIAAGHVGLRRELTDVRSAEAALQAELDAVEADIDEAGGKRVDLRVSQEIVRRQLVGAIDRLEEASLEEAEELERLQVRTKARVSTEKALGAVMAALGNASQQSEQNQVLLEALDRCLDGATRAANALSVGDVERALAAIADVRDTCRQIGVVIAP